MKHVRNTTDDELEELEPPPVPADLSDEEHAAFSKYRHQLFSNLIQRAAGADWYVDLQGTRLRGTAPHDLDMGREPVEVFVFLDPYFESIFVRCAGFEVNSKAKLLGGEKPEDFIRRIRAQSECHIAFEREDGMSKVSVSLCRARPPNRIPFMALLALVVELINKVVEETHLLREYLGYTSSAMLN